MPDLKPRELWAVAPLIALIIVLGIYPEAGAQYHQPGRAQHAGQERHSTDPVPPHPATAPVSRAAGTAAGKSRTAGEVRARNGRGTGSLLLATAGKSPVVKQATPSEALLKQGSSG